MEGKKTDEMKRRPKKKITIPRREPSVKHISEGIVYVTADKLTCSSCGCYPVEEPFIPISAKLIRQCQRTPKTLYELAAEQVERLQYPEALGWSTEEVEAWMRDVVGFPQYVECIRDNRIDGLRLLTLEDPSRLPPMNVHHFEHIKEISSRVRELYGLDFVHFSRSIDLPARYPFTHAVRYRSRTVPTWSPTAAMSKCDILRMMKILGPEPYKMDHFDLVWYMKPDFPKTLFGPTIKIKTIGIYRYREPTESEQECLIPRKFKFDLTIKDSQQFIWVKRLRERKREKKVKKEKPVQYNSVPPGMKGKDLLLLRRKMPKQKFFNPTAVPRTPKKKGVF